MRRGTVGMRGPCCDQRRFQRKRRALVHRIAMHESHCRSPSDGDRYIVGLGATGEWAGWDLNVALWTDGAWLRLPPRTGWRAWVEDEGLLMVYDGSGWVGTTPAALQNLALHGLGTKADASNPFSAKLTWTKIGLNNTDYNDQGAFDAGTNLFTAPVDGTYLFGATLLYKINASATARMRGRLVLNGATEIRGSFGEISATQVTLATAIWLQTMVPLTAGDTVELQGYFRVADGYFAADHTSFWGCKIG